MILTFDAHECPTCHKENDPMGALGKMLAFRCRNCGLAYQVTAAGARVSRG